LIEVDVPVDVSSSLFWGLAPAKDGSVWFDGGEKLARLKPDGSFETFPIQLRGMISLDSSENAWVPELDGTIARLSSTGIATYSFPNTIYQLQQAPDGHMWFVDLGGAPVSRLGWIDRDGTKMFFPALNIDTFAWPHSIARGPDGALWFGTSDSRLIRLTSASDVTIYDLPWPDVPLGAFAVLESNRIVMVLNGELLDFQAQGGTRLSSPAAIPGPAPYVAKSDADRVAYNALAGRAGTEVKIVRVNSWMGSHAAEFEFSVNPQRYEGYEAWVYVVEDQASWRLYEIASIPPLRGQPPSPGLRDVLFFKSGCLNTHEAPSKGSKALHCLGTKTTVDIDCCPTYAEGLIWWHLVGYGFAAQPYLYCLEVDYESRPECS
jgi:hypothetical protein